MESQAVRGLPRDLRAVLRRPADGGKPEEILTGFVDGEEHALGRPVGVAVDGRGALLVADDVGNRIWRVTPAQRAVSSR